MTHLVECPGFDRGDGDLGMAYRLSHAPTLSLMVVGVDFGGDAHWCLYARL